MRTQRPSTSHPGLLTLPALSLACLSLAHGQPGPQTQQTTTFQAPAPVDTSAAQPLSLEEALNLARKNNRDLRAARERLRIAHADVERALAALLPKLTAQGKYTYNYPEVSVDFSSFGLVLGTFGNVVQDQVMTGQYRPSAAVLKQLTDLQNQQATLGGALPSGPAVIVPQNQLDGILALTVPLIAPPAYSAYHGARQGYRGQVKQTEATEAQLLQSVASAFYAAAGADELVAARQHAIEVAGQTLDNSRARLEAGVVNRVEVTRAELALVQAQQRLLEAEDTRMSAYRTLDTLVLLRRPFKVLPPPEPVADTRSDGELMSDALRLRPEVAALEAQLRASKAQAISGGLRWLPSISGFGNIRLTNASGFSTGRHDFYAAGLQADWVLFDGFERDAARHTAEAQANDAALRLRQLRDTIGDDVQNGRRQVLTRREGLKTAERSVKLAQETLDLVRIQHDAGTATQLDLLTAQDQLVQAEVSRAQARFDLSLADISLRRLIGVFPGSASLSAP